MDGPVASIPIPVPGREHIAPIFSYRCPVHSCLVGLSGDGRLVTCCPGCLAEATAATLRIRLKRVIADAHRVEEAVA